MSKLGRLGRLWTLGKFAANFLADSEFAESAVPGPVGQTGSGGLGPSTLQVGEPNSWRTDFLHHPGAGPGRAGAARPVRPPSSSPRQANRPPEGWPRGRGAPADSVPPCCARPRPHVGRTSASLRTLAGPTTASRQTPRERGRRGLRPLAGVPEEAPKWVETDGALGTLPAPPPRALRDPAVASRRSRPTWGTTAGASLRPSATAQVHQPPARRTDPRMPWSTRSAVARISPITAKPKRREMVSDEGSST